MLLSLRALTTLLLFSFVVLCFATQNVTISAVTGDELTGQQVIYTPPTSWEFITLPEATIAGSLFNTILPDEFPSITLLFDGIAISVVCVLVQDGSFTEMGFILDGVPAGSYVFTSRSETQEFLYNVTVYETFDLDPPTKLPGGVHNLTIQSFTTMQFDYAIYTPVPPKGRSDRAGVIAGAVISALAALALVVFLSFMVRRRMLARRNGRRTWSIASFEAGKGSPKSKDYAYPSIAMPVLVRDSKKYQNLFDPAPEKLAHSGAAGQSAHRVPVPQLSYEPETQSPFSDEHSAVRECVVQDASAQERVKSDDASVDREAL